MPTETPHERKFAARMLMICIGLVALVAILALLAMGFAHHDRPYPRPNSNPHASFTH